MKRGLLVVSLALLLLIQIAWSQEEDLAHLSPKIVDLSFDELKASGKSVIIFQVPNEDGKEISGSVGGLAIARYKAETGEVTKTTLAATGSRMIIPKDCVLIVSLHDTLLKSNTPCYQILFETIRISEWDYRKRGSP